MADVNWLVWIGEAVVALIVIFALARLFFIDAKLQDIVERMDRILNEMGKTK